MDEDKVNVKSFVNFQKLTPTELMQLTQSGRVFRTTEIANACALFDYPDLQGRAISSGKVDEDILVHLSKSVYPTIRMAIASHAKSPKLIKELSMDPHLDVKKCAIYNSFAPADVALLRAKYELEKRLKQKII
jgi:hypothetical protein